MLSTRVGAREARAGMSWLAWLLLAACSGAAGGYGSIGGSINNLVGEGLVLQLNGNATIDIAANATTFRFATRYVQGSRYDVTVLVQPRNPAQTCSVANGTGTMGSGDVSDIVVNCQIIAPSGLAYSPNPATYLVGRPIEPNVPSVAEGTVVSYSVEPTVLPAGLSFQTSTGVISGTPTAITPLTAYTVTASNSQGSATAELRITVNDQGAPSNLTYSTNPAYHKTGTAITPNGPSSDDGAVDSYVIEPHLPPGLSLNTSTGVISGIPTADSETASYTVTARNSRGETTAVVTVTVSPQTFTTTGSMAAARIGHTATMLPDRRVLIAGGRGASGTVLGSAELYDGALREFAGTEPLVTSRHSHTATLLSGGKVLIVGGDRSKDFDAITESAELYDPVTGQFASTGSLRMARYGHTATLLLSGEVLVAGGSNPGPLFASAEIYRPTSGFFVAAGDLLTARDHHTATLLPDGRVLITGGYGAAGALGSAELFDPALYDPTSPPERVFTVTGSLVTARARHTATLLPDGEVLITGGYGAAGALASAELYDPVLGKFRATGDLITARFGHTATLLPSGKVLITGGYGTGGYEVPLASAELYDPTSRTFTATGSLVTLSGSHSATLLPSGRVLVTGSNTSAELYW